MNGGSQRQSIGRVVSYVETVDYEGHIHHYSNEECKFAYRHSIFQHRKEVIIEVGLVLDKETDKSDIQKKMIEILSARRKKFPLKQPSCGSVFVSNPDMYDSYGPPGQIIESLGFKGMCRGDAQVSHRHANFIVNNGQATSEDILFLINVIKKSVYDKTGYQMAVEAKLITPYGEIKSI
jgi:UDP-N-acetylmuramate dehydrogenase